MSDYLRSGLRPEHRDLWQQMSDVGERSRPGIRRSLQTFEWSQLGHHGFSQIKLPRLSKHLFQSSLRERQCEFRKQLLRELRRPTGSLRQRLPKHRGVFLLGQRLDLWAGRPELRHAMPPRDSFSELGEQRGGVPGFGFQLRKLLRCPESVLPQRRDLVQKPVHDELQRVRSPRRHRRLSQQYFFPAREAPCPFWRR